MFYEVVYFHFYLCTPYNWEKLDTEKLNLRIQDLPLFISSVYLSSCTSVQHVKSTKQ